MGNPNLQLQFRSLLNSLANTCILMYEFYEEEMKVIALLGLAVLAFRVGKMTVTDPLEGEIRKTKEILQTRQQYTQVLPKRIKSITYKIATLLALVLIAALAYLGLEQYRPELLKRIDVKILLFVGGALLSGTVLLWVYQLALKYKLSRGRYNDHHITERLSTIVKMLGGKTEILLKYALAKDEFSKIKQAPIGLCSRERCREHRELLREKSLTIAILIDNVLNFQWCSVCKKRPPFDEFLDYRSKGYAKKEGLAEEAQVMDRNSYLLEEVEKMAKWGKEVGPCNCSMRYWNESKKEILAFKKREKEIDQRIAMFQARKNLKR